MKRCAPGFPLPSARFAALTSALVFGTVSPSMHAGLFPQNLADHSLCCGVRGPVGLEGQPLNEPTARSEGGLASGAGLVPTLAAAASAPAPPTSNASQVPEASAPEQVGGYFKLGFDRLGGYKFTPPAYDPATKPDAPIPSVADQIPESVRKYDGKKAVVTGFMLPVKMDGQLVTEFLLVRDPMMCCYGVVPQMNEWVVVKMAKGGVQAVMDVPVSFYGQLRVKEMFENGYMTGIYLLEGEKMGEVKG